MEVLQMTMLNFNLDLQKQDNFSKAFTARQGDAGEQFSVTLFDNQVPYTPVSGDVVSLRVVTPTGKFASVAGSVNGNKVVFTLNGQVTSEAGYYQRAYVAVSNGSKLRTTQDLIFFSLGNSDINKGQADYYVAELDKLLQQLNEEFDQWLEEREQDYSDLLARIVALTNRVTGLEQDVQDLIDAIQANRINTTNVFNTALITPPETPSKMRIDGHSFDFKGWGTQLFNNTATMQMLEPNKTYHAEYFAELLTLDGGAIYGAQAHGGMAIYSGKTGYPTVWLAEGVSGDFTNAKIGDKIKRSTTFTTPPELYNPDAGYQILGYGRRDNTGIVDAVRFHDVMVQEGSIFTGYQTNPDNTMTRYDEQFYNKSVFPDPRLTGTLPPTVEAIDGKQIEIVYGTSGLSLKNTTDRRLRVYWNAFQFNLSAEQSKQAFELVVRLRASSGLQLLEFGYSAGDNLQVKPTYAWSFYSGVIKPASSTGFSIWLDANQSIDIAEMYIRPTSDETVSLLMPEGINLNEFTSRGHYKMRNALGTLPPDLESTTYFYLENRPLDSLSNVKQTLTVRTGLNLGNADYTYMRQRVNGNWSTWQRVLTAQMDGNQASKTGVNLNDEKLSGEFIYINPTNAPVSGRTWYGNIQRYGGAFVMQTLYDTNGYDDMYVRKLVNTTWQEWRKFGNELFSDGRVDTSAVDFNTLVTTDTVVNTSALNSPDGAASTSWYTEVIRYGSSGNYVYQRATRISNTRPYTYERQMFNGTWGAWQKVTIDLNYLPVEDGGSAKDLNNFGTTMEFMIYNPINAPAPTQTWYVEVKGYNATYCRQTATSTGTADNTYTRQKVNNVWTPWRLVSKTTV